MSRINKIYYPKDRLGTVILLFHINSQNLKNNLTMGSSVSKYYDDLEDKEWWDKKKKESLIKRFIKWIMRQKSGLLS